VLTGFLVLAVLFVVIPGLMWLLHSLNEHVENRVPPHRRELVAMYESFHKFLCAVRCAALRAID
jgi:hypothetical protein